MAPKNNFSFGNKNSIKVELDKMKATETGSMYKVVPYDEIETNGLNDYPITEIDQLKEEIKSFGLIKPLGLIPNEPGEGNKKYRLFDGERRFTAIGLLLAEGDDRFAIGIPCMIDNKILKPVDEEIKLILANTQREMTPELKRSKVLRLSELYKKKEEEDGVKLNITKLIAGHLNLGERQVQKMNQVNTNLIPELQDALDDSKLSLDKAAQISSLPKTTQTKVANMIENNSDININKLDLKNLAKKPVKKNSPGKKEEKSSKDLTGLIVEIRKSLNKLLIISNEYKSKHAEIPPELKDFYSEMNKNIESLQKAVEEE